MRFSTKSRYGLRLMAELACAAPGRATPLKEISERQQLSLKYLEQLVTPLARAGLVKSERGSQGGYRLVKDPAQTTAGEIIAAMEGSVAPIPCLESEINECPLSGQCATLPFWAGLDEVINQDPARVTPADIAPSMATAPRQPNCRSIRPKAPAAKRRSAARPDVRRTSAPPAWIDAGPAGAAADAPGAKNRAPAKKHLDICRQIRYNKQAFDGMPGV